MNSVMNAQLMEILVYQLTNVRNCLNKGVFKELMVNVSFYLKKTSVLFLILVIL